MSTQYDIGTRARMIDVAERLFAEQGIGGVSLRTVGAAAGQRNNSAAQYHFGSKQGLIEAIVEVRSVPVEERRAALVAELESAGSAPAVRDLLPVIIAPLAETIKDRPGTHYLRFLAQVIAEPGVRDAWSTGAVRSASIAWVHRRLRTLLPGLSAADFRRRMEWCALLALQCLADHEHRRHTGTAPASATPKAVRELVEAQAALLESPG